MALALFGLTLLTRLPFATTNLYAPDSVLYVRGIERFDPFDQQPQPPGYLWYVLVLRAIASVNPLAYAVDAARSVFNNHLTDPSVAKGVIILGVLAVIVLMWLPANNRYAKARKAARR